MSGAGRRNPDRYAEDRWPPFSLILKSLLAAAGIAVLLVASAQLIHLLVLVFGAMVIAVLIRALADPIKRHSSLGDGWSVALSVLVIITVLALVGWLFGSQVRSQFSTLSEMLPRAWNDVQQRIASLPGGEQLLGSMDKLSTGGSVISDVGQLAWMVGGFIADLLLVLFGALFMAVNPRLYRDGLLKLVPKQHRHLADQAIGESGTALRRWMIGQLISMLIVGMLTGIGLSLVGVPSGVALGVIAGVAEFIPYAGPVIAAVPALLLALAKDTQTALLALAVIVAVQQIEGSLIMPIVQKNVVSLPPALTVFGVVAFGLLFGIPGLIFAAPLLVVAFVLVKRLYVRELLDTETQIPGQSGD